MTTTDPTKQIVASFASEIGGQLLDGDDVSSEDIDWEFAIEHRTGTTMLIRFAQFYESTTGETIEQPPVLVCRHVNYTEDEPVSAHLRVVIEDDPNGFQKDVADLSVTFDEDAGELRFLLDEMNLPDTPLQHVTIRDTDGEFRVLENVTAMG